MPESISARQRASAPAVVRQGATTDTVEEATDHHPVSAQALVEPLDTNDYQNVTWKEGTNKPLVSGFAAVQVRVARGKQKREPAWLVIECPQGDDAPAKYCLSNLPEDTSLATLVAIAKGRWRIERDYQALKQELGLNHYEGRNWRGHHRATLCTVAYGFLFMERLRCGDQKIRLCQAVTVPEGYWPRGHATRTTPRG